MVAVCRCEKGVAMLVGQRKVDRRHDLKHKRQIRHVAALAASRGREAVPLFLERTSVADVSARGICVETLLAK